MATGNSTHPGTGDGSACVDQLNDTDTGRWQVTTHTAIYLIDLDQRTLLRVPGAGREHGLDRGRGEVYVIRDLPDDHQPHLLRQVLRCQAGHPMTLVVQTDRPTIRTSTPVLEIRRLTPPDSKDDAMTDHPDPSQPQTARHDSDVMPDEPGPFTDFGQFGPGQIDKRVLVQDTYWVDITGRPHRLNDMPHDYLDNVRRFLLDVAEEWWLVELLVHATEAAGRATVNPDDPEAVRVLTEARQLSDAGPAAWMAATPLMRRIAELLDPPEP